MTGKEEIGTVNRERRKTMVTVLEVEVTTNNSHKSSSNQSNKNNKKEWSTLAEASKVKSNHFFGKISPYKQRKEEIFETVEIENYGESETNNDDQQNEHTIIVPDT